MTCLSTELTRRSLALRCHLCPVLG